MNAFTRNAGAIALVSGSLLLSACDLPGVGSAVANGGASKTSAKAPAASPPRIAASRTVAAATPRAKTISTLALSPPAQGSDLRSALQAALNSAANGDVVELPAGKYLLSGQVNIPANLRVSIVGKGRWNPATGTGTLLYLNQTRAGGTTTMLYAKSGSNPTLSDFTIRGTPAAFLDETVGIKLALASDFRITRMRIEYFGRAGIDILHSDTAPRGIVDHNELYHNYKGDGQGLGYGVVVYAENKQWVPDPKFGSDNFIFIEDNVFDQHRHAVAAGGAGLYVARYNYMKDTFIASAIDAHESTPGASPGTGNYYSTRAIEAYNNVIVNTISRQMTPITPDTVDENGSDGTLSQFGIGIRGGEALVHHNIISGYVYGGAIVDNYYESRADTRYPIPSQVGYLSGLAGGEGHVGRDAVNGNGDFFYWANTFTPHPFRSVPWWYQGAMPYFNNYNPEAFMLSRDYHVSLTADSTGVDYSFKPGYKPYTYPNPRAIGGISRLDIGIPVSNISGLYTSAYTWAVTIPKDMPSLTFSIKGGTGRAAMYVRLNAQPTTTTHYCASTTDPTRLPCVWTNAKAGTYYVMVYGLGDYAGAQLRVTAP